MTQKRVHQILKNWNTKGVKICPITDYNPATKNCPFLTKIEKENASMRGNSDTRERKKEEKEQEQEDMIEFIS